MSRNNFSCDGWTLSPIYDFCSLSSFDCGDDDLNEYFRKDAVAHKNHLLGQPYKLVNDDYQDTIIATVDLCNDSIDKRKFPKDGEDRPELLEQKRYPHYPAVKITRLGVDKDFQGNNVGTFCLNMLKTLFVTDNRTGCRFMTVDAYNNEATLKFYVKNNFRFFTTDDKKRYTRAMFFDLKRFKID